MGRSAINVCQINIAYIYIVSKNGATIVGWRCCYFAYPFQLVLNLDLIFISITCIFNPNRSLEIFSCKKSDYSRSCHRYSIFILTQYVSFVQFQDKMKAKFSNDRFGFKNLWVVTPFYRCISVRFYQRSDCYFHVASFTLLSELFSPYPPHHIFGQ